MILRGRAQKHEEGDPIAFIHHKKKKKGKGGSSGSGKPHPQNYNIKIGRYMESSNIGCYSFHMNVHYAQDYPHKNNALQYNSRSNNNMFNNRIRGDNRRNNNNGRGEIRRCAMSGYEEEHYPQKNSVNTRHESDVANQS